MRPGFLNNEEFAQVVRNAPLVAIDLIIRDPDGLGIDVDNAMNVLAVTCERRPLVFFNLKAILENKERSPDPGDNQEEYSHEQRTLEVRYELEIRNQLHQQIKEIVGLVRAKEELALLKNSRAWRMTAALRRLSSALRNSGIM